MSTTTLTRDTWEKLLRALDPDVAQAAARYERLRRCLIALYRARALPDPEDLADQALDGVARALTGDRHDVGGALREAVREVGDAARRARRAQAMALAALPAVPAAAPAHDPDDALGRLCQCLDELPELARRSLLAYEGAGDDRSRRRQALAAELGIPLNALRVRMHRLRVRLLARIEDPRPPAPSPAAGVAQRPLRLGEPVTDREPGDVPALHDPAPRAARREQREPDRRRAQADQDPRQDDHVRGPLHADDRPRLEEPRAGQGQRADRAAAERDPHEPQQLDGVDPHAERRHRLLAIADRLQRGAGRPSQPREHQAELPRTEPRAIQ